MTLVILIALPFHISFRILLLYLQNILLGFQWIYVFCYCCYFDTFGKYTVIISSSTFPVLLPFFSLSQIVHTWMLDLLLCSHGFLRLYSFVSLSLYFHSLALIYSFESYVSIVLSSRSWILSVLPSILLLKSSTGVFFALVIAFFSCKISLWFSFISHIVMKVETFLFCHLFQGFL